MEKALNGFTLVETMVAATVLAFAFVGFFAAYAQSLRLLDASRQLSRGGDIALANVEFLRTRSWEQLTNVYVTTSATVPVQTSSNMIESINTVVSATTNSPVCTHLELIAGDPLNIGLNNVKRDIIFSPTLPAANLTNTILQATVLVHYDSKWGTRQTNSMTTFLTKGGMTADIAY